MDTKVLKIGDDKEFQQNSCYFTNLPFFALFRAGKSALPFRALFLGPPYSARLCFLALSLILFLATFASLLFLNVSTETFKGRIVELTYSSSLSRG
jgi:hypothetical protein